eukprot:12011841-Alexandrium_andersonii.AAC.1
MREARMVGAAPQHTPMRLHPSQPRGQHPLSAQRGGDATAARRAETSGRCADGPTAVSRAPGSAGVRRRAWMRNRGP